MAKVPNLQDVDRHLELLGEIASYDDRAAAIIGGSFLESYLGYAIAFRMRNDLSRAQIEEFFDRGPFSNFFAKIETAFSFNLIGPRIKADMHTIRRIRNHFAHWLDIDSFDHPDITAECRALNVVKLGEGRHGAEITDPRLQFTDTVMELCSALAVQCKDAPARPPPGIPRLMH